MIEKGKPERSKNLVSRRDFLVAAGAAIAADGFATTQAAQAATTTVTASHVTATKTAATTVTSAPVTTTTSGISGTFTATSQGFGGVVTTTVTLTNSIVTKVTGEGPNETPDRGGGGCAAAMSVAEQMKAKGMPVSVLAVEVAGKYGGTAANCGEPFGVNPPRYKAAYNNGKDYCDYDSLYNNWINDYAHGACKKEMVKLMMDESGKTIDWLHFDHGFLFTTAMAGFGTNTWPDKFQYVYITNKSAGQGLPQGAVFGNRSTSVGRYFDHIVKDFTDAGGKYMLAARGESRRI
jgi:hypothetical protein